MNIHKMPRKLQVCREKDKTVSKNGGIVARLGFFMYLCKVTALYLIINICKRRQAGERKVHGGGKG